MFKYESYNHIINDSVKTNKNFEKRLLNNFCIKIDFLDNFENDKTFAELLEIVNKKDYHKKPGYELNILGRKHYLTKNNY
jgi:hypothetical protein